MKEIKHVLTKQDFEMNPQLKEEGLKVGDEIGIPDGEAE